MEAQLNQAGTFAAQNYAESLFRQVPTDSRFLQTSFQKFPPNSSLDAESINFVLNRFEAANVYQIQNTHLEIQIVIHDKNNTVPAKTVKVAPVNNILHSTFESVTLKINDQTITKSSSNYPYKAYITNTLTYPSFVKVSQLQTEGYYSDLANHMAVTQNTGFNQRNQIFRKEDKSDTDYKPEGVRFFGRLQLDLIGCQTGLVPGTKVEIEVTIH